MAHGTVFAGATLAGFVRDVLERSELVFYLLTIGMVYFFWWAQRELAMEAGTRRQSN